MEENETNELEIVEEYEDVDCSEIDFLGIDRNNWEEPEYIQLYNKHVGTNRKIRQESAL